MLPQGNGIPDPGKVEQIASGIGNPVDLTQGPGGDLYYVNHEGGQVVAREVRDLADRARHGDAGQLDRAGHRPPRRLGLERPERQLRDRPLALGPQRQRPVRRRRGQSGEEVDWHIDTPGMYPVTLEVRSTSGLTDTVDDHRRRGQQPARGPSSTRPTTVGAPGCWQVGDTIHFSGHATRRRGRRADRRRPGLEDPDGPLPGWLPHAHDRDATSGGSGSFSAPGPRIPLAPRDPPHGHRQRRRVDRGRRRPASRRPPRSTWRRPRPACR